MDSLRRVIANLPDDSTKVKSLINLAGYYYRSNAVEAVNLGAQAKTLAEEIKYSSGLAQAYKAIGIGYYFQKNDLEAILNWQQALATFQTINDQQGVANMMSNLGAIYFNGGDDKTAIEYYLDALEVAEEVKDSLRIATVYMNIGAVYSNKDETWEMAEDYYLRSLPISEALGNFDAIGTVSVNLGELYLLKAQQLNDTTSLSSALKYLEKALDTYKKSATGNVPYAVNAIGKVYAERGDYEAAIAYHLQALELAEANGAVIEMSQALSELGKTKLKQKQYKAAIDYFTRAEKLVRENDLVNSDMQDIFEGLAEAYLAIKEYQKAYRYRQSYDTVRDTLFRADILSQIQTQTLTYDVKNREAQMALQEATIKRQKTIRNASIVVGILILLMALGLLNRYSFIRKTNRIIAFEKDRSDKLLLNILPEETAEELKNKGSATPKHYDKVSVLFTDFKGFTKIAEKLTPAELVEELNNCFLKFDRIIDKYNLEKIKTIGDAYMCAGGIPIANDTNPVDIVHAGLEIKEFMENLKKEREARGEDFWELRIGIHTGPVIAGVVGKNKFAYDIWGDAVNTASRMESSGIPGKVNISGETYTLIKDQFECTYRGKIQAKNKGEIDMYIVDKLKKEEPKAESIAV